MKQVKAVLLILLVTMLLPIGALAQTQEEWNLSCNNKTSCSTTVYKTDAKHEVKETIPANTYVKIQGTIVSVLEYGKKFCKINYNGSVGYILTSCLQFISPDEQPVGTGVLTYMGKATGRTTINVRNDADGDSAKITEWKTGTSVQVYGEKDGWYEIEANGMRGYVMEKFLTMEDE